MSAADTQMRAFRDAMVLNTLQRVNGNRRRAAAELGMSLRTFLYWLQDMRRRGVNVPARKAGGAVTVDA